jgi:glycine cleavage system transcriptional repressor
MTTDYRIAIFSPDRIGLVANITGTLFDLGGNLGDTTFAVLGKGAEFSTVCNLPMSVSRQEVEEQLRGLPELAEADITVVPFALQPIHGPDAVITHHFTIVGGDSPGLIARISEVFVEFESNIVRLNAQTRPAPEGARYQIDIDAWIPANHETNCLATITNTTAILQMRCIAVRIETETPQR